MALVPQANSNGTATPMDETIVLIRHGEEPRPALGQLSCKGLNRALALPAVLAKYGRPTAIYAPSPADRIKDGDNGPTAPMYSYLRPLTTIEPYAIELGMPVNTQIGYDELVRLQQEVLQPVFAHGYVLLAWEHVQSVLFARQMFAAYGEDPAAVPPWPNSDYDTVYVFHLTTDASGRKHLEFRVDHEGLEGRLPDTCPKVTLLPEPTMPSAPATVH